MKVGIAWQRLGSETVFKVDRDRKRIILNSALRSKIERALGNKGRIEMFEYMLLMALRDHFGERRSKKLEKFEELMNKSVLEYLR